jgi:hypothetical protein
MRSRRVFFAATALVTLTSCAGAQTNAGSPDGAGGITGVELATLEIRHDQVDRFEHCPPAGEIGQGWLPNLPEWHPPAASASVAMPENAFAATGVARSQTASADTDPASEASLATLVDEASNATRGVFRRCYHRGLLLDPTQDGHVAVVLRVGQSGKVAHVETWGACDLAPETLVCMRDEAARLELRPPAGGSATVTVPAVFTSGVARRHGPNDGYAAAAYVAVEEMRPRLHYCEEVAARAGKSVFGTATMKVDVDAEGHGVHVAVDPWVGGHEILACAAMVLRDGTYPAPPTGRGRIIVPVAFNPRPGSK